MAFSAYLKLNHLRKHTGMLIHVCSLVLEVQDGYSVQKVLERFRMCENGENVLWDSVDWSTLFQSNIKTEQKTERCSSL